MNDWITISAGVAATALVVDRVFGYPDWLYRAIRHPVVWIGALIGWADRRGNLAAMPFALRRASGIALVAGIGLVTLAATLPLALLLRALGPIGVLAEGILTASLVAQRSLHDHVAAVARGLRSSLAEGRRAVSMIVGRDPEALNEPEIVKAAIESLAENTADGVVAPVFWALVAGLPGAALYKAINTADSMVGHKSDRHLAFGWAAARLDDLVNLPASRTCALLFALTALVFPGASAQGAVRAAWRDARRHVSPNAGWPEAAMAGALGFKLGGSRRYGGQTVDLAHMGDGQALADADDIDRALAFYRAAITLLAGLVLAGLAALALF